MNWKKHKPRVKNLLSQGGPDYIAHEWGNSRVKNS